MSTAARKESGELLRRLQNGKMLGMPKSRPMSIVGPRVHELRVSDEHDTWRVVYRIDPEVILIAEVFSKKTQETPLEVIQACRQRYRKYDES